MLVPADLLQEISASDLVNLGSIQESTVSDLNNLTDTGFYYFGSNGASNSPIAGGYFFIIVLVSGTRKVQVYFRGGTTPSAYYRANNGNTWSSWALISAAPPTSNGTYTLKATVTSSGTTYSWAT